MKLSLFVVVAAVVGALGCEATGTRGDAMDDPAGASGTTSGGGAGSKGTGAGAGGGVGFTDAGAPIGDCPAEAELIYLTGVGAELWSFWPPTFTFTKIGTLTCTTYPTHMTVDRQGVAWVVGTPLGS